MTKATAQSELVEVFKDSSDTFEYLAYVFTVLGIWAGGLFLGLFLLGFSSQLAALFSALLTLIAYLLLLLLFAIRRQQDLNLRLRVTTSSEGEQKQRALALQNQISALSQELSRELDEVKSDWLARYNNLLRTSEEAATRSELRVRALEDRLRDAASTAEQTTELRRALSARDVELSRLMRDITSVSSISNERDVQIRQLQAALTNAEKEVVKVREAIRRPIIQVTVALRPRFLSGPAIAAVLRNLGDGPAANIRLSVKYFDDAERLIGESSPGVQPMTPHMASEVLLGPTPGATKVQLEVIYSDATGTEFRELGTWPLPKRNR